MFQVSSKDPLVVRGVSKSFKRGRRPIHAVQDVSFRVGRGEIFGLIGANGSGKSTLIRILSTLVLADAGQVEVFGYDIERDSMEARQLINRVSADPSFFRQMSALENLLFFGRVYGLDGAEVKRNAERDPRPARAESQPPAGHGQGAVAWPAAEDRGGPRVPDLADADAARRADDRSRPPQPARRAGLHPRGPARARRHHPADDARHGRGRGAVQPHRVSRRRCDRRRGHPARAARPRWQRPRRQRHRMEDVFMALTGKSVEDDEEEGTYV